MQCNSLKDLGNRHAIFWMILLIENSSDEIINFTNLKYLKTQTQKMMEMKMLKKIILYKTRFQLPNRPSQTHEDSR